MKVFKALFLSLFLAPFATTAAVKVEKEKEGIYWAEYDYVKRNSLIYTVDTVAKVCFVSALAGGGVTYAMTQIDCAQFANRPEWKEIITWL